MSFSVVGFLARRIADKSLVGFEPLGRGDDSIIGVDEGDVCDVVVVGCERKPWRSFDWRLLYIANADAIIDDISPVLVGKRIVLFVRARLPNAWTYCSAISNEAALRPSWEKKGILIELILKIENFTSDWSRSETNWRAWARAVAFARMASASPLALLICSSLKPSLAKMAACFVPSALFIWLSRIPSLSKIVARLRL